MVNSVIFGMNCNQSILIKLHVNLVWNVRWSFNGYIVEQSKLNIKSNVSVINSFWFQRTVFFQPAIPDFQFLQRKINGKRQVPSTEFYLHFIITHSIFQSCFCGIIKSALTGSFQVELLGFFVLFRLVAVLITIILELLGQYKKGTRTEWRRNSLIQ